VNPFRLRAANPRVTAAADTVGLRAVAEWPVTVVAHWADGGRNWIDVRVWSFAIVVLFYSAEIGRFDADNVLALLILTAGILAVVWVWRQIRQRESRYELEIDASRLTLRTMSKRLGRRTRTSVVTVERHRPLCLVAAEIGLDWRWRRLTILDRRMRVATMLAGPAITSVEPVSPATAIWCARHGLRLNALGRVAEPVSVTALIGTWWADPGSRFRHVGRTKPPVAWIEPDLARARSWSQGKLRRQTGWSLGLLIALGTLTILTPTAWTLLDAVATAVPVVFAAAWIAPSFRRSVRDP
jgi:hypothetical protein